MKSFSQTCFTKFSTRWSLWRRQTSTERCQSSILARRRHQRQCHRRLRCWQRRSQTFYSKAYFNLSRLVAANDDDDDYTDAKKCQNKVTFDLTRSSFNTTSKNFVATAIEHFSIRIFEHRISVYVSRNVTTKTLSKQGSNVRWRLNSTEHVWKDVTMTTMATRRRRLRRRRVRWDVV